MFKQSLYRYSLDVFILHSQLLIFFLNAVLKETTNNVVIITLSYKLNSAAE